MLSFRAFLAWARRAARLVRRVKDDEELARYLNSLRRIRSDSTVKPEALMPSTGKRELSVFRIFALNAPAIWRKGLEVLASSQSSLKGRVDVPAGAFAESSLTIEVDNRPWGHVNIRGWPKEKDAQKLLCQELAARARFTPYDKKEATSAAH